MMLVHVFFFNVRCRLLLHTVAPRRCAGSPRLRDTLHPLLPFSQLHRHAAAPDTAPEVGSPVKGSEFVLAIHAHAIPVLGDIEVVRKTPIPFFVVRRSARIPMQNITTLAYRKPPFVPYTS